MLQPATVNTPLTLLSSLGWTFLSPKQCLAYRGGKQDEVVLRPVLREVLSARTFMAEGTFNETAYDISDNFVSELPCKL